MKHLLLVDDDLNDVELTLAALAESNLANEVVVAYDGAEALDYLYRRGKFSARQDRFPAVILLDLKMPKVSGIEVLRQIKADADLKLIPVVMLTSSREVTDLEQWATNLRRDSFMSNMLCRSRCHLDPEVRGDNKVSRLKWIPVTDLEQCYQLGVNAYVVKPVQVQDLMNAIKTIGVFWAVINELPPGIRKM